MNGGKMIGTVLALMIADIKRISQVFGGFKSVDMLEKSQLAKVQKQGRNDPAFKKQLFIRIYLPLI